MATLDHNIAAVPIERLGDEVRASYRASFAQSLALGHREPLVIPWSIFAAFILPTLWLTVPHTATHVRGGGGLLSSLRFRRAVTWAVVAFCLVLNCRVAWTTASGNFAYGYATGLMAGWGAMSTLTLFVWLSPQEEAARIVRRRKRKRMEVGDKNSVAATATATAAVAHDVDKVNGEATQENGVRHRNGLQNGAKTYSSTNTTEHDESEYEYVWQPFPADRPWSERLNWAFDMTTNFRLNGWNCSISAIPRPRMTTDALSDGTAIVDMESMPVETKAGYRRSLTLSDFTSSRLSNMALCYVILDFLATFMMKDPYFILGPDGPRYPLPDYLAALPPWFLHLYRLIFSLLAVLFAIFGIFNLNDLGQYHLMSHIVTVRGELWQHPSTMGSFTQILDRGLAGWWGAWWHQTFRNQFLAPAIWLTRKCHIRRGTPAGIITTLLVTFLGSGFLHMGGSISSVPATKVWRAPAFFLLQAVGIAIQYVLSVAARRAWHSVLSAPPPRWLTRTGNLASTLAWLYCTGQLFTDDMAASGIWLLEPVPFSFFRALGFGQPGDRWWRWDQYYWPSWYTADRWWRSGMAM